MVCITSDAGFSPFQVGFSMVITMMLYINKCLDDYFSSVSTASVYACTIGVNSGRYSSLGSKFLCGNWRYVVSHYFSMISLLPRSISASLFF